MKEINIMVANVKLEEELNVLHFDVKINHKFQIGSLDMRQKIQVGDYTWSIFMKEDDYVFIMLDKEFPVNIDKFGDNNNYLNSNARKAANNCDASIQALQIFGDDVLIPTRLDLLSNDGLDDYGVCEGDLFGIITHDIYRMNRKNIDISYMATCTPNSTPSGYGSSGIQVIDCGGYVNHYGCDCYDVVRPFCILTSNIFVTPVNKL